MRPSWCDISATPPPTIFISSCAPSQQEIQYWFNRLDMNHDKQITMEEMFVAIDFMGMKATRNQVETFFDQVMGSKDNNFYMKCVKAGP